MKKPPVLATLGLAAVVSLGAFVVGCGGEPEPPPMKAEDFPAIQQKQQDILQRERGGAAKTSKKAQ
ncbi:hypothetical protein [Planctomyces sp. SH-PL62]|uniref:hypothetical protein n=1 Tax=Planctomyces sp. SH-PL62 TaxID=1636152 RepID=UPI00078E49D0|nr:hypothetical protein [Planctomyces sp. SH-PL62]AMV40555.1 hypothetical protein VT85_24205 [Planctomyces sp. SH-PL62]